MSYGQIYHQLIIIMVRRLWTDCLDLSRYAYNSVRGNLLELTHCIPLACQTASAPEYNQWK